MTPRERITVATVLKDTPTVVSLLREALREHLNVARTAKALGFSEGYLWRLLRKFPQAKEGLTLQKKGRPKVPKLG